MTGPRAESGVESRTDSRSESPLDPPAAEPSSRTIADAVVVQLVARAIGTVASITTVAVTTRHLGVTDYGLLTTAIVFMGLWTGLTELGVGAVIVRRVSSGKGDLGELTGVNLGLSLLYCLPVAVVAGASGLLVYHGRGDDHAVLLVVSTSLVFTAVGNCYTPVFMSKVRFTTVAVSDVLARVGALAATLVAIESHAGLVWFGLAQVVPPLIQMVVLGIGAHRLHPFRARFDWRQSRSLLIESLPQTGVLIVATLYWRADAVLLSVLGTVREVGSYGLAYNVSFTLSVLSSFFLASSLSTMTSRYAADRAGFARFVATGMEAMLFLGVPIAVFGGILARPIVTLLASGEFSGTTAVPLALLLCGVVLTFLTGLLSQALFAAHDQRFLLKLNVVNVTVNIILNIALVPPFGAVGAASALLVSEVSGLVITSIRLRRTCGYGTPYPFMGRLLVPTLVGAAVAVGGLLLHLPVLVSGAAATVVYVGINIVRGPVRLSTIRTIRSGGTDAGAETDPHDGVADGVDRRSDERTP